MFHACPSAYDIRFMAKESLFKIPFLGWGMSRSGFVPIRRENPRHSAELLQNLAAQRAPYSYINFPEGTRSADGRLQPLKRGAIGLALRLNMPVVPVTIIDACHANPKGARRVRPGEVQVVFHEPLELAGSAGFQPANEGGQDGRAPEGRQDACAPRINSRDAWLERIQETIASALPEDQKPCS